MENVTLLRQRHASPHQALNGPSSQVQQKNKGTSSLRGPPNTCQAFAAGAAADRCHVRGNGAPVLWACGRVWLLQCTALHRSALHWATC